MKEKNKRIAIGGMGGAIGGALGAVSGSSSWVVVAILSAAFGLVAAWSMNGMFDKK